MRVLLKKYPSRLLKHHTCILPRHCSTLQRDLTAFPRMPLPSFAPPASIPRLAAAPIESSSSSTSSAKVQAVSASIEDFKDAFNHSVPLLGIRVNAKDVGQLRKGELAKSRVILNVSRISNVVKDPSGDVNSRILLLNATAESDLSPDAAAYIKAQGYELVPYEIEITYDLYTADEVLSSILPYDDSKGTPTAYATIGHIAHLNLREEYLPFRYVIGQVILQKNSIIRTVVNKLDSIDTVYRFFDMELLAGEPDYVATVSESGCLLTFDFRKVYFNSRLHTEHGRIVSLLQPGQVISDVMAGVGPFAIPAAKKGCIVYANDLNPASYESLTSNAKQNRVHDGCKTYCEDGRFFIKESVKRAWKREIQGWTGLKSSKERSKEIRARQAAAKGSQKQSTSPAPAQSTPSTSATPQPSRLIDHFVMNLPDSALEFLDAYRGAYKSLAEEVGSDALEEEIRNKSPQSWPMVHVHCFTKDINNPHGDICKRANHALGLAHDHPDRLIPPPSPKGLHNSNSRQRRVTDNASAQSQNDDIAEVISSSSSSSSSSSPTPDLHLHWVRTVSPNKDMWCLSFRVPRSVLFDE